MIDLPSNWILTGTALVGFGIALSWLVEFLTRTLDEGRYGWQSSLRRRLGVAPDKRIAELRWVTLALQLILWPLLGFVLLQVWGLEDLSLAFVDRLLGTGFAVGTATIVPGKVILGLLAFLLLVTFTRWFKRKLERDWLPLTRMEPSVRMSVATLYGYITFIIAMLIGLSAAGLDLSKIAIVAGALSVGIGFGLQNIVNNFVSGLILLFERPVRLGDYIKVGTTEGFVRQIRIRSTELENGEHVSIIVPNSTLLSAEVQNWNYRNTIGQAAVAVSVAYGSDPEQVRELLLEVAKEHPLVIPDGERMDVPGPFVTFTALAESSLNFELRANVRDINAKGGVASDLRFAIYRSFREHGIEVPVPQRDVWLRNAQDMCRAPAEAEPATRSDPIA
ncbi:MAG: mechanosensitive ion channel family protein [Panacagrimonas sp.]